MPLQISGYFKIKFTYRYFKINTDEIVQKKVIFPNKIEYISALK